MQLSVHGKKFVSKSVEVFRFSLQWGFIPLVVYLGKIIIYNKKNFKKF